MQHSAATYSRPSLAWENLAFLHGLTELPILPKGILHPDDARPTLEHGTNGVIVSNCGGRQVDGAIGALDALPGVVEAVNGRAPVLFDSVIRGGAGAFRRWRWGNGRLCGATLCVRIRDCGESRCARGVAQSAGQF